MHLQGRRLVVVKSSDYIHYFLCHSTEQATYRQLIACYEYRDDIHPLAARLQFLHLYKSKQYKEAVDFFHLNCNEVEITIEEFSQDEASVNHGDIFAEISLDIDNQITELMATVNPTLGNNEDKEPDAFQSDETDEDKS